MTIHIIKCKPEYFQPLIEDKKKAEVRLDDRNYKVDDICIICELNSYRYVEVRISHILSNFEGLKDERWICFSFDVISRRDHPSWD